MQRVRQSDTASGVAKAFIDAAKGLPSCPSHVHLRPQDVPFWEAIVSHKPRDEWVEVQLVAAAQLARTQADIEEWTRTMDTEEPVVHSGPSGIPKPNPLLLVIEAATRRELALFRALGLSSIEDTDTNTRRSKTLKAARQVRAQLADDPLLAS